MPSQLNVIPTLFVSQLQLHFDSADVDNERFLILKIGQEGSDMPVQVRIENTDFFQIAVQGSPLRFYSKVDFTPAPSGTYIHVRYAPKQVGRHVGELLIETAYATQTVPLSGRTTGLLTRAMPPPARNRQQALPAPDPTASSPAYAPARSQWLKALVVLGLVGGGSILAYRWQLDRSSSPSTLAVPATQVTSTPQPAKPLIDKPLSTESAPRSVSSRRTEIRPQPVPPPTIAQEPAPEPEPAERVTPAPPTQVTTARAERPAVAEPTPRQSRVTTTEEAPAETAQPEPAKPAATARVTAEKTKKRTAPPAPLPKPAESSSESELERALNKNQ